MSDPTIASRFAQPARLPREVPEKAEAFLRVALLPASDELPPFVAMMTWLAAPDQRKASFFRIHHAAGIVGCSAIIHYKNSSNLRNEYAGEAPISIKFT